ncbi:MAG TPA: type II toxin-antitoxin system HicA family toxin [Acidimicrobiales bacterium]|nr:type II toxin-antitoxin system HicA family toxin [Acidimicrobiales bacterium]HUB69208.1 type II toxin-antitoxin system HicA family toxin [Acidimicrobiales bacterium]
MTVREVIRILGDNGWQMVRQRGSHRQFRRAGEVAVITVAGHLGSEVPSGTLANIWRQAGLKGQR